MQPFTGTLNGTAQTIKKTGTRLRSLQLINTTAAVAYLQLFDDVLGNVTLGTTVPTLSFGVPANGTLDLKIPEQGWPFGKGIVAAGTTTRTGNTGANLDANCFYE